MFSLGHESSYQFARLRFYRTSPLCLLKSAVIAGRLANHPSGSIFKMIPVNTIIYQLLHI